MSRTPKKSTFPSTTFPQAFSQFLQNTGLNTTKITIQVFLYSDQMLLWCIRILLKIVRILGNDDDNTFIMRLYSLSNNEDRLSGRQQ